MVLTPNKVMQGCASLPVCKYRIRKQIQKNKSIPCLLALKGLSGTWQWFVERGHFFQLLLTVENVQKLWKETCISAHVLNQLEAQVMFEKIHFPLISIVRQLLKEKTWWMVVARLKKKKSKRRQKGKQEALIPLFDSVCLLPWLWRLIVIHPGRMSVAIISWITA